MLIVNGLRVLLWCQQPA